MFESGGGEVRLQCCNAAIAVPYDRTQSCRNVFSHLCYVHRLCAFCHLIGSTSGVGCKSESIVDKVEGTQAEVTPHVSVEKQHR